MELQIVNKCFFSLPVVLASGVVLLRTVLLWANFLLGPDTLNIWQEVSLAFFQFGDTNKLGRFR